MPSNSHHNALPKGYKLHWYVIESILGRGGFGITYKALDTNLNRIVAIKEFLPLELCYRDQTDSINPLSQEDGEQYKWGLERFITEAQTLAQFEHPNIVRVIAVFEENNTGYMVMNYEDGQELNEILKGKKTLLEPELVGIIMPLLDGIDKVHKTGFIHRDIKPQNIIIRPNGAPVLIDFGSARQALGGKTKTLTSLVTPGYAPFEQYYSKSDKQGPWTDIYAMAATAYRCMIGAVPLNSVDRSDAIIHGQPDYIVHAIDAGKGNYSKHILKAIDHGLEFSPEDRPQTITEWKEDFRKVKRPERLHHRDEADIFSHEAIAAQTRVVNIPEVKQRPSHSISLLPILMVLLAILLCVSAYQNREVIEGFLFTNKPGKVADSPLVSPQQSVDIQPEPQPPAVTGIEVQQGVIDTINDHLDQAEKALSENKLLTPANESALHHYTQVLMMDRQNAVARTGIQTIVGKLLDRAETAMGSDDFFTAQQDINSARALDRTLPRVKRMQEQLLARQEALRQEQARIQAEQKALEDAPTEEEIKQKEIVSLLEMADKDFKAMRLTSPKGSNSFQHYQKILELDANNTDAQQGLQAITDKYIEIARKSAGQKNYERAFSLLDKAGSVTPDSENIELARNEIETTQQQEQEELASAEAEKAAAEQAVESVETDNQPSEPYINPDKTLFEKISIFKIDLNGIRYKYFEEIGLNQNELLGLISGSVRNSGYGVSNQDFDGILSMTFSPNYTSNILWSYNTNVKILSHDNVRLWEATESSVQQGFKENTRIENLAPARNGFINLVNLFLSDHRRNVAEKPATGTETEKLHSIAVVYKGPSKNQFRSIGLNIDGLITEVEEILGSYGIETGENFPTRLELEFKPTIQSQKIWYYYVSVSLKSKANQFLWNRWEDTKGAREITNLTPAKNTFIKLVNKFVEEYGLLKLSGADTNTQNETEKSNLSVSTSTNTKATDEYPDTPATASLAGKFVTIPGGTYQPGNTGKSVEIKPFRMGKFEVTQEQWKEVMGNNPSFNKGCDKCPVEYVTWKEVQGFILKLNQKTGSDFRLPTAAEWEYACARGNHGRNCNGKNLDALYAVALARRILTPVDQNSPDRSGLVNMPDNVWEWTCSEYSSTYNGNELKCKDTSDYSVAAIRGGKKYMIQADGASAYTNMNHYNLRYDNIGFRLASD